MMQEQAEMAAKAKSKANVPVEQMQTVHRDKSGKIVSLEEKLTTDKELLQNTNKATLATFSGGAK